MLAINKPNRVTNGENLKYIQINSLGYLQFSYLSFVKKSCMVSYQLSINGKTYPIEAEPQMPLLWAIRELAGLTGTKYGCGMAQCGACTIHLNGNPVRSCSTPVAAAANQKITTIEGLGSETLHSIQQAWIAEQVPQCGYCQSGQIMSAVALLKRNPKPTDQDIDAAMQGNICRCGTYPRIRKAIKAAAQMSMKKTKGF
jgi:isoquinoline 1-oxidoreductase alpha subunit